MTVDPAKLAWAVHLRDTGSTIAEIVAKTEIPRTSLYRHLPPRAPDSLTAAGDATAVQRDQPASTPPAQVDPGDVGDDLAWGREQ